MKDEATRQAAFAFLVELIPPKIDPSDDEPKDWNSID
jgi:hypothetical protein